MGTGAAPAGAVHPHRDLSPRPGTAWSRTSATAGPWPTELSPSRPRGPPAPASIGTSSGRRARPGPASPRRPASISGSSCAELRIPAARGCGSSPGRGSSRWRESQTACAVHSSASAEHGEGQPGHLARRDRAERDEEREQHHDRQHENPERVAHRRAHARTAIAHPKPPPRSPWRDCTTAQERGRTPSLRVSGGLRRGGRIVALRARRRRGSGTASGGRLRGPCGASAVWASVAGLGDLHGGHAQLHHQPAQLDEGPRAGRRRPRPGLPSASRFS